ncbi:MULTISPECIES: DUF1761 domain-containing protein [unclassified Streptomyces]|uniref:DUF1761 domain-containing protein n=1 Tax=unclassified Streptomyces TaxID=2593676 RepID=UPI000A1FEA50|nr:DUF1761 domain-containing protein [Streptomyces sp. 13-12-16]OSP44541.1 hypothetical protein B7767_04335 [Streptomyces sp. 13-12-16]
MFSVLADINWAAVAVVAVGSVLLAGVWFAVVIAKPYAVALGREGAPAPAQTAVAMAGPPACLLVTVLTSAVLVEALDITGMGDAVVFGLLVGVGYLGAMTFQIAINPNFPRPLYYGLLNAPFFVLTSVLGSVVLVAMR